MLKWRIEYYPNIVDKIINTIRKYPRITYALHRMCIDIGDIFKNTVDEYKYYHNLLKHKIVLPLIKYNFTIMEHYILTFDIEYGINRQLIQAISSNRTLLGLTIQGKVTYMGIKSLLNCIEKHKSIKILDMHKIYLPYNSILTNFIKNCNLKYISINIDYLNNEGLKSLFDTLNKNKRLRGLYMQTWDYYNSRSKLMKYVTEFIENNDSLISFQLDSFCCSVTQYVRLAIALIQNKNLVHSELTYLDCNGNDLKLVNTYENYLIKKNIKNIKLKSLKYVVTEFLKKYNSGNITKYIDMLPKDVFFDSFIFQLGTKDVFEPINSKFYKFDICRILI